MLAAAGDAERFCQDPGRARDEPVLPVTGEEGNLPPLRAITASGDTDAYWDWHIQQEHRRNHLSHYKDSPGPRRDGLGLAA